MVFTHLVLVQDLETTHFQVSIVKKLLVTNELHTHFYALYSTSIDVEKMREVEILVVASCCSNQR